MKKFVFTIVNFLWNPILYLKFMRWSNQLEGLSFKRKQTILLTSNATLGGMSLNIKYLISCCTALVFEIDHIIDVKENSTNLTSDQLIEKYNVLKIIESIDNIDEGVKQVIISQLSILIENDTTASQSTNLTEYLSNSIYSIGLPLLVAVIDKVNNTSANLDYIFNSATVIRILSDLATVEKDANEPGKNITDFISADEAQKLLKESLEKFKLYQPTIKSEIFLSKLTKLSSKFYKPSKDFEY